MKAYKTAYIAVVAALFCVLLAAAPVLYALDAAGIIEYDVVYNEFDEPREYEGFASFLNAAEAAKLSLTATYTSYMPFYTDMVFAYGKLNAALNKPVFSALHALRRSPAAEIPAGAEVTVDPRSLVDSDYSFLVASREHRYYLIDCEFADGEHISFLDTAVNLTEAEKTERVMRQAELLNKIANANDTVNFYFMMYTRMQDTDYYTDILPDEPSTKEYAEAFMSMLDDKIKAEMWDIGSARDRCERVYLTDHHWSAYGKYLGYRQLIGLMCPDTEPVPLGEPVEFPKSRFYGSAGRISQFTDLWDTFVAYDYDLPEYVTDPAWDFDERVSSLASKEYLTPDKNIYAIFHPEMYKVTYPDNHTGRNLLILGDSFTQGFAPLIASAFDTTVIRYYTGYEGLDYNDIIEKYGITDVLFAQFSDRILFDLYGDDKLASFKLD